MPWTKWLPGAILILVALIAGFWLGRSRATHQPQKQETGAVIIDASKYPTLQAAFDALPEKGGLVRLPAGTFELNQPLIISRDDVRVEGAGAATHLINRNTNGQPALILRPKGLPKKKEEKKENTGTRPDPDRKEKRDVDVPEQKDNKEIKDLKDLKDLKQQDPKAPKEQKNKQPPPKTKIWRVQLADFRIEGNPKSGDGVLAEGVNEIYLHGMSIDHNGGHGIHLIDCYEDPRICDCILTYNKLAGLNILRGHDIVVNGNQFEENQDALRCIDSFNLCMNGNNLDDHLRHGVVIENTYGSVLSGNMIEECNGTAIIIDRECYGITVSANVIAHNMEGGVDLKGAWGCAISANTFTIVKDRALVVGPKSGRITITGNNFSNSYLGGKVKREDPATGILLQDTSDITISGNIFTGLVKHAVLAEGKCQRLAITGNVMADLFRKAKDTGLAIDLGKASEVIVENNVIEKQFQGNKTKQ